MLRFLLSRPVTDGSTDLYASDGTASGTINLGASRFGLDLDPGLDPDFTQFKGGTDFIGSSVDGPEAYTEVYRSDGTVAGTGASLVAGAGGPLDPDGLWALGGLLLTSGNTQEATPGVWASPDGINFKEIETGVGTSDLVVSHGVGIFAGFAQGSSTASAGLWRTDGTAAGTYGIDPKGVTLDPTDIATVAKGETVFVNQNADGTGSLWITDGTASGTHQVVDAALGNDIDPAGHDDIATATGRAIFTAFGQDNERSVWASDGTANGTVELRANGPVLGQVRNPSGYVQWGDKVLFTTGYDTEVTDGTKAGTVSLVAGDPYFYAGLGSRVFIATPGSGQAPALYTSDGTSKGTVPLKIKGLKAATGDFTQVNGQVVFAGVDLSGREALFSSDGTPAGSHELTLPAGLTIDPNNLPVIGPLPSLPPLSATLPSPLRTGIQTVTGTGGVPGLQLERITQGTYNTPGQTGWVKATVAADGTWSVQLKFDKPGMLAHVYAENGGSKTVVDLVNGTPVSPASGGASLASLAASMQASVIAADMSVKAASAAPSRIAAQPGSQGGSATDLLHVAPLAVPMPDLLKASHHAS